MSNKIESLSISIKPVDSRCRFWGKVIRVDDALPMPQDIKAANDIPVPYAARGEEELFPGDIYIKGEEHSHRRARGWDYVVRALTADGVEIRVWPNAETKAAIKEWGGLEKAYLAGSGDVAACVRIAHAIRYGWMPAFTNVESDES